MEKYFAYAHNLNQKNLCKRIKRNTNGQLAILPYYKLVFNVRSKNNTKTFANISPSDNDFVIGIVYNLSKKELEVLDRYEDVHLGTYQRIKVKILMDGHFVVAWTYICLNEDWKILGVSPEESYCRNIDESILQKLI